MQADPTTNVVDDAFEARAATLFEEQARQQYWHVDRVFAVLMLLQWTTGIALSLTVSPALWGNTPDPRLHGWAAVLLGGLLSVPPIFLALRCPGSAITRYTICVAQMLWSALLIHLTAGRIETHFHIFGSLALIAFYREWRLLVLAAAVIGIDHFVRGAFWPASVFGVEHASPWRSVEHMLWIGFEDLFLIMHSRRSRAERLHIAQKQASLEHAHTSMESEVEARTAELQCATEFLESANMSLQHERQRALEASEQVRGEQMLLQSIVDQIPFEIYWKDVDGAYQGGNRAFVVSCGLESPTELVGKRDVDLPWTEAEAEMHQRDDATIMASQEARLGIEETRRLSNGETRHRLTSKVPLSDHKGRPLGVLAIFADITERKQMESELRRAEKLSSIGQLAAGIAHEINTPTQFVGDNLRFLGDSCTDIFKVIESYNKELDTDDPQPWEERKQRVRAALEELDYEFLMEELPRAIEQSLEGVERVTTIVRAMKDFSHPGQEGRTIIDLNKAIESTIAVACSEWKYVADVVTELAPDLPAVSCYVGELNQSLLNILINAAHAIAEVVGEDGGSKGTIKVTSNRHDDQVEIRVEDTGGGIPAEHQERVFDQFFTTKQVGKGTGQGLSMAYATIVEKHGGTLFFESEPGKGTTFTIRLPLVEPDQADAAALAEASS